MSEPIYVRVTFEPQHRLSGSPTGQLIKVLVEVPFEKARQKAGDSEYENVIDYAALELAETVARTLAFRKIEERLTAIGEPAKNLQIPAGRIQKEQISNPRLMCFLHLKRSGTTAEPVCWSSSSRKILDHGSRPYSRSSKFAEFLVGRKD